MRIEKVDQSLEKIRNSATPQIVEIGGMSFEVGDQVYPPGTLEKILWQYLSNELDRKFLKDANILDYGTGCGCLAIGMAKYVRHVLAIDINEHAISCAMRNAEMHGTKNVAFEVSNGLASISETQKYDLILASMPWDDADANDPLEYAMYDPGMQMRNSLFSEASRLLTEDGFIIATYADFAEQRNKFFGCRNDFVFSKLKSFEIKSEIHHLYRIKPRR